MPPFVARLAEFRSVDAGQPEDPAAHLDRIPVDYGHRGNILGLGRGGDSECEYTDQRHDRGDDRHRTEAPHASSFVGMAHRSRRRNEKHQTAGFEHGRP